MEVTLSVFRYNIYIISILFIIFDMEETLFFPRAKGNYLPDDC
jgi:NADH:ubiquinone oxidoreductase subunit 3 (subunit A)